MSFKLKKQETNIKNCSFIINRPVPHPTTNYYRQIVGYQGGFLKVSNNLFEVDHNFQEEDNGDDCKDEEEEEDIGTTQAIFAMNTSVNIGGETYPNNTFTNFTAGIGIFNFFITTPLSIKNNDFSGVQRGIVLNTTTGATVEGNIFDIPAGISEDNPSYGLLTYFSNGIDIKNNTFTTSSSNETKGAVFVENEALNFVDENGRVFDNTFNGPFAAATELERDNQGLILQCNDYTGASIDWFLPSSNGIDRLRQQGACDGDISGIDVEAYGFGGTWSENSDNFVDNIVNNSDGSFTIQYDPFWFDFENPNPNVYNPATFSGSSNVSQFKCDESDDSESGCTPGGVPNPIVGKPTNSILIDIQNDLANNDLHGAIAKLETINDVWADKLLVGNYWYLQDLTLANQNLQQIPTTTVANVAFIDIYTIVLNTPMGEQPNPTEEQIIRDYAIHSDVAIAAMAESVLAYYYDEEFIRYSTPVPTSHSSKRANNKGMAIA